MRIISTEEITKNIKEMCIEANYRLSSDMENSIISALENEESSLGKHILSQLKENMDIASEESIPICQDTGMAVVFMKVGQGVLIQGGNLTEAINEGIKQGYEEGYLRKSVVSDPLIRINSNDNTPGIIHYDIVPGENIEITVAPKGFGSENMSRIYMLKPADGVEGVKDFVIKTAVDAGPNPCPPTIVGVGIGGTIEMATLLSKKALLRPIGKHNKDSRYAKLENEILREINKSGVGPAGLGGETTALSVHIEYFPTHIAGLPVAVNICCHASRHAQKII